MGLLHQYGHPKITLKVYHLFFGLFFVLTLSATRVFGQDLTPYFRSVEAGDLDQVRNDLPKLIEQYPNNPAVAYLDAILQERAEEAVIAYKKLIQNFPDSPYVDDAMVKVGEYLYARGLYTQASMELAKLPKAFPKSVHLQRTIDLQISSLVAIGETDSVNYYLKFYKKRFPFLDLNYSFDPSKPLTVRSLTATVPTTLANGMKQPSVSSLPGAPKPQFSSEDKANLESSVPTPKPKTPVQTSRPFVVQVGAYGSAKNAERQKMLLVKEGYVVEVWPITSRGKKLHTIQVVRFSTKSEAEKVGKKLKSDFGYSYLVLKRPE